MDKEAWRAAVPTDCSPPGSSVHGSLQARILEWVAMSSSRGIFLTQGLNLRLLHWQENSLLLKSLIWDEVVPSAKMMVTGAPRFQQGDRWHDARLTFSSYISASFLKTI